MTQPYTLLENGWIYRVREPETEPSHRVIILVHGWTGDENSMWAFSHSLPKNAWLIAPRGMVTASPTGYGWTQTDLQSLSPIEQLSRPASEFRHHINALLHFLKVSTDTVSLAGFSQGAALIYTLLHLYPDWIEKAACMSGFLPPTSGRDSGNLSTFKGQVLITHGSEDRMIPVQEAWRAAYALKKAGISVETIIEPTGHKLGPDGARGLKQFFDSNEVRVN
ncbi:MAG: hypothetical protein GYA48_03460 [Chloroflexi bacterium]|nr:hypothetical protein [Chloroflexota bacterium]